VSSQAVASTPTAWAPGHHPGERRLLLGWAGEVVGLLEFLLRVDVVLEGEVQAGARLQRLCFGEGPVGQVVYAPGRTGVALLDRAALRRRLVEPTGFEGPALEAARERGRAWLVARGGVQGRLEAVTDWRRLGELRLLDPGLSQTFSTARLLERWVGEAALADPLVLRARRRAGRAVVAVVRAGAGEGEVTEARWQAQLAAEAGLQRAEGRARRRHRSVMVGLLLNDRLRQL
jgi:hypothetical protein